jgi:CheY-like chemotaxis protein
MSPAGSLLVVDDDVKVADLLRAVFEEQGYVVTCASNGRDALVLASLSRPDAILLDMRMPDRDGPEVLCDLLALDGSLTVVMAAEDEDEELASALREVGAFDYVSKPFETRNLEQVVGLAVMVGKRKAILPEETPWQCEPRALVDDAAMPDPEAWCGLCQERVRPADTTAVREREAFYHADCWLSRFTADAASATQLAQH